MTVIVTTKPKGHETICPVIETHGTACYYCLEYAKTKVFLDRQIVKTDKMKFNESQRDLFAQEDEGV